MPFTGYELVTRLQQVHQTAATLEQLRHGPDDHAVRAQGRRREDDARVQPRGRGRPAGLAHRAHRRQSLQFGDMRALLKVPMEAPSLLDLPTDRIQESDLADVLWRDPSGIDILLAPPRVEMAEMVTVRDLEKTISACCAACTRS